MIDFKELERQYQAQNMVQSDDHPANNLDPRLSMTGLWKNEETGKYECFFGSGKLVLEKLEEPLDNGATWGLFYHFTGDKNKEFSSKITNLWVAKGKDCLYLSGGLGANVSLSIFPNDRQTDLKKHPGQIIYLKQKRFKPKVNANDYELQ